MSEREDLVLDALLGDSNGVEQDAAFERAQIELTPDEREELEDLREVLSLARAQESAASAQWSPIREGALVGRVLARTTREDLSWRGDLALVTGFVRDRLAASPVLKLVAASLLVHLAALPVLGWYVLREPETRPTITFDIPLETADFAAAEEPTLPARDPAERLAERTENTRRRARFALATAAEAAPLDAPDLDQEPLEIRLLALRTWRAEDRQGEDTWAWLEDGARFAAATRVQRALWIDLLLDRNVAGDARPELLAAGLNQLAAAERAGGVGDPEAPATGRLEALVLRRARSYGLWEAGNGFDPRSAPLPFEPAWCAAVRAALVEAGLGDRSGLAAILSACRG